MRPLLLLGLLALAAVLAGLAAGSVPVSAGDLWQVLTGGGDELNRSVVLELRLPRVLAALAAGALLALAGVLMQVLLANPLADPYILGTSGGAAAGALLSIVLGAGAIVVPTAAFAGALGSTLLVFALARGRGAWSATRLLLTGVVVAAGWGALITLLLSTAPERDLRGMLFWLMGDLSQAAAPLPPLALAAVAVALAWPFARHLNLLSRGELQASALGVDVKRLRAAVYVGAALLTAAAVTLGGTIGFVGLVVPHLLRLLWGSDHRLLLPASALAGGTLLVVADTLARTVVAPLQLPVGVLTALVGVPLFLLLLQHGARAAGGRA